MPIFEVLIYEFYELNRLNKNLIFMLLMVVKIVLRDDGRQVFDKMPEWL